jgi:four helix bundle protein
MNNFEQEFKQRTKEFARRVIRATDGFPPRMSAGVLGKQILRSSTSIGANYRSACRARSKSEFIAKLAIAEEEADETLYWLELLRDSDLLSEKEFSMLFEEGNQITAIIVSSIKTARNTLKRQFPGNIAVKDNCVA